MTLKEFEQQYAKRSGVTVEWLHAHHQHGVPCGCQEPGCEGWQMKHIPYEDCQPPQPGPEPEKKEDEK